MNKGLISGLVLLVLGLFAGVLLAGVNSITSPIIADNEMKAKFAAMSEVYTPLADTTIQTVASPDGSGDTLYTFTPSGATDPTYFVTQTLIDDTTSAIDTIFTVYPTTAGAVVLGVSPSAIVYSVKAYGYQSYVKMLIAINPDLTIAGSKIIEESETAGIGSQADNWTFVQSGTSITDLSGFDSIAGATFTSNAVRACYNAVQSQATLDFGGGSQ